MNNQIYLVLIILLGNPIFLRGQSDSLYLSKHLVRENDSLPYRLLLPVDFNEEKQYPLNLVLYGAGEKGNDITTRLTTHQNRYQ